MSPTSQQPDITSIEDPTLQHVMPASTPRHLASSTDFHASQNNTHPPPASDSFLSTPWLRATRGIGDGGTLIPTPTASMTTVGGTSEISARPSQSDGALGSRLQQSTSAPSKSHNGPAVIPDLPPSFPPGGQYHQVYQDPPLNISSFVDMDGYGPARRQRIAPDLDALFDELASLDGAEKSVIPLLSQPR